MLCSDLIKSGKRYKLTSSTFSHQTHKAVEEWRPKLSPLCKISASFSRLHQTPAAVFTACATQFYPHPVPRSRLTGEPNTVTSRQTVCLQTWATQKHVKSTESEQDPSNQRRQAEAPAAPSALCRLTRVGWKPEQKAKGTGAEPRSSRRGRRSGAGVSSSGGVRMSRLIRRKEPSGNELRRGRSSPSRPARRRAGATTAPVTQTWRRS